MKTNLLREGYIYNANDDLAVKVFTRVLYVSTGPDNLINSNCFEIWRLNSNECTFFINKNKFELKSKDIVIISQNDNYGYELYKSRVDFSVIKIYPDIFTSLLPKNQIIKNKFELLEINPKISNYVERGTPLYEKITLIINKVNNYFINKECDCEILAISELFSFFTILAKFSENDNQQNRKGTRPDTALVKSIEYINSHLSEELTLENISDVCGLSPNYFSNLFRSQTGIKLWDYIGEQRINLATKLLLENPNEPIISIALRCGFNNCPNFNRTFKKITGQTPKKYKSLVVRQESFNE